MATGLDHQCAAKGESCDHGICHHCQEVLEHVKSLSGKLASDFTGVMRAVHVFPSFLDVRLNTAKTDGRLY